MKVIYASSDVSAVAASCLPCAPCVGNVHLRTRPDMSSPGTAPIIWSGRGYVRGLRRARASSPAPDHGPGAGDKLMNYDEVYNGPG